MPARGAYIYLDVGQGLGHPLDPFGWVFHSTDTRLVRRVARVLEGEFDDGTVHVFSGRKIGDSWIHADEQIEWWSDNRSDGLRDWALRCAQIVQVLRPHGVNPAAEACPAAKVTRGHPSPSTVAEDVRIAVRARIVTAPQTPMSRPVPIAKAAEPAGKRPDLLLKMLRTRGYPIGGARGTYVAELSHIVATVPGKRRTIEKWADEKYPAR